MILTELANDSFLLFIDPIGMSSTLDTWNRDFGVKALMFENWASIKGGGVVGREVGRELTRELGPDVSDASSSDWSSCVPGGTIFWS